ncbi:unnamed protein product [Prunus armeniaca]
MAARAMEMTAVGSYCCSTIMLFDKGIWSSGSQVPVYLWGGSQVYKKRFIAHLHYLTSEAHFQKWRTPFDFSIPYDVHVKSVEPSNDDVACTDVLEVSGRWESDVNDDPRLTNMLPLLLCDVINKRIDLDLDMANLEILRGGNYITPTRMISLTNEKRNVAPMLDKYEAATSRVRDVSLLRKKCRLPSVVIKSSSKEMLSAEKTKYGTSSSSSARVKHLLGVNSKKVGGIKNIQDILLKSSAKKLKLFNLLYKDVYSRPGSSTEKQRAVDFTHRSSSHLHQSRDEDRIGKTAPLSSKCAPSVELREVKHRADPTSLTHFKARMVMAKKAKELSAQAKSLTSARADGPKVDKPSYVGHVSMSDLLKMNFSSSSSICAKLVDHLHQANDVGPFSILSLEKQKDVVIALLQKRVIFATEAVRSSYELVILRTSYVIAY